MAVLVSPLFQGRNINFFACTLFWLTANTAGVQNYRELKFWAPRKRVVAAKPKPAPAVEAGGPAIPAMGAMEEVEVEPKAAPKAEESATRELEELYDLMDVQE